MKYLILLISLNCFADSECFSREFDSKLEENGEVTSEEITEISDFCSMETQDEMDSQ